MINIYPSNETAFADNGLKILKPLKVLVRKEDNGDYYVDLKDTIENLEYYQSGMIIRVPTPWGKQCFRLKNPSIENKKIIVRGYHIYFDSANYIIQDSYVVNKNCNDALDHLNTATDVTSPFTTLSDINSVNSFRCVRKSLEEAVSEVINRWGGHLVRNNWAIEIRQNIGTDKGIVLSYGKNIVNIKSNENWNNVATKILPIGKDGLLLDEIYLTNSEDLYDIPYTKVIKFDQINIVEEDFTDDNGDFDVDGYNTALEENLRQQAENYLDRNKLPKVNYTLSAYLKDVSDVGDVIYVKHPKCKIDLATNVIALDYDVILERIVKVEFGNFKNNLKNLIGNVTSKITEEITQNTKEALGKLENALVDATNSIKNTLGNSYVIYDGNKILIVDTLPKEDATNVIMINNGGIGFSQSGINGTFKSAWTIDGTLNMQNLNTINFVGDLIKGGTLKLGSNLDESGNLELYSDSNKLICEMNKDGFTVYCDDNSIVQLNSSSGIVAYDSQGNKIYWRENGEFHIKKSVIEEEITIAQKMRLIPITTDTNTGIGIVAMV